MAATNDIYDELRELSPALHDLKKTVVQPEVPAGYFEQLPDFVLARVNETPVSFLSGIDRNRKPTVPDAYFDSLADRVMQQIREQEQTVGPIKPERKRTGFHIIYFRQLAVAATVLGVIALGALLIQRQTTTANDCEDGIACLTREEIRQYVHDHADEFEPEQIQEAFPAAIDIDAANVAVAEENISTAPAINETQIERYIEENPATIDFEDASTDIF